MDYPTIFLIAFGLCMDSFAVSLSCGFFCANRFLFNALKLSAWLSVFQGLMPVMGWFLGNSLLSLIVTFDHWIAFMLLLAVGLKMIYEAICLDEHPKERTLSIPLLLSLSIATSIDALAVGFSFALLRTDIILPALIIFCVTFVTSFLGYYLGKKTLPRFRKTCEILGGLILIGIGTKILLKHLS